MTNHLSVNWKYCQFSHKEWVTVISGYIRGVSRDRLGSVLLLQKLIQRLRVSAGKNLALKWVTLNCITLGIKAGSVTFPLRKIYFWQETANCYQIISIGHQWCHNFKFKFKFIYSHLFNCNTTHLQYVTCRCRPDKVR